jgi:hypothetical protein
MCRTSQDIANTLRGSVISPLPRTRVCMWTHNALTGRGFSEIPQASSNTDNVEVLPAWPISAQARVRWRTVSGRDIHFSGCHLSLLSLTLEQCASFKI